MKTGRPPSEDTCSFRAKVLPPQAAGAVAPAFAFVVPPQPAGSTARNEPVVTLRRDGDRVTGIRIQCTCGQVIELACTY